MSNMLASLRVELTLKRVVFMFKKNTGLIEIVEEIGDRNETVELFGKE